MCGFATHDRCLVCLSSIVEEERSSGQNGSESGRDDVGGNRERTMKDKVDATEDQLRRAPRGTLHHRIWSGDCLKPLRQKLASEKDRDIAQSVNIEGLAAWEKGLMTRPPLPKTKPLKYDTFHWYIRPAELPVEGDVYLDGSLLDNVAPEVARTGWVAVVVVDKAGVTIAAAYGVPPAYATGIERGGSVGPVPVYEVHTSLHL